MAQAVRVGALGGTANRGDRFFEGLATLIAASVPVLLVAIVLLLTADAWPALQRFGGSFLIDTTWDPVNEKFGSAAYVYGTVVTSLIALLLAAPIGVGCALFVAEYAPLWMRAPVSFLIELLAAIPSIIYGLWGVFVLGPIMRGAVEPFLKNTVGNVPVVGALFSGPAVATRMSRPTAGPLNSAPTTGTLPTVLLRNGSTAPRMIGPRTKTPHRP